MSSRAKAARREELLREKEEQTTVHLGVSGNGGVGGRSLPYRMVTNGLEDGPWPNGHDDYRSNRFQLKVEGKKYTFECKTAENASGEEYAMNIWRNAIPSRQGFILLFDITSRQSFDDLQNHRSFILNQIAQKDVPMIVCGNKCDLEAQRQVTAEEARVLAGEWGYPYIEVSAKTGQNCEECFRSIATTVLQRRRANGEEKHIASCTLL